MWLFNPETISIHVMTKTVFKALSKITKVGKIATGSGCG